MQIRECCLERCSLFIASIELNTCRKRVAKTKYFYVGVVDRMLKPLCFRRQINSDDFKEGSSLPNGGVYMFSGLNKWGRLKKFIIIIVYTSPKIQKKNIART